MKKKGFIILIEVVFLLYLKILCGNMKRSQPLLTKHKIFNLQQKIFST